MKTKKPSVVVIGGGTGTYTILSALKDKNVKVTALMTMVDDGGSNKVLRDEFGLLPTSGIRLAMVALSAEQSLMRDLFVYRFHQGNGISGMTFGNLFLAAMADITGSQEKAIEATAKFLNVRGEILPISYDNVQLVAQYEDGTRVIGEHYIDEPEHDGKLRITNMWTEPKATINPQARTAIQSADLIILGPGDFYTNTIANLVIHGVPEAIMQSQGKLVFVTNLMTKYGDAYQYRASDYIRDLSKYIPASRLNVVIINNDEAFPVAAIQKYREEHSEPVKNDLSSKTINPSVQIMQKPLLSATIIDMQKGDRVKRSMIRHDSEKLAQAIMEILAAKHE